MKQIILVGGGGHCESVIDVIEQECRFQIAGVVDNSKLLGSKVLGYEVIGNDTDLQKFSEKFDYALVTVGQIKSPDIRIQLFKLLKKHGFILPTIISPRAYVSSSAQVGEGTVVMHDALVNTKVKIGSNVIINSKALIEHGCLIESNCHISTGAIINGDVVVKKNTFVGSHAVTNQSTVIFAGSFIKAGSIVK